ncbi:MAG: hypothetical protein AAF938_06890 [Myxococcota bacterium]
MKRIGSLVLAAALGALAYGVLNGPSARPERSSPNGPMDSENVAPIAVGEPAPAFEQSAAPTAPPSPAPPSAPAPYRCADLRDSGDVNRPSIWGLYQERLAELRDRSPGLWREASDALRALLGAMQRDPDSLPPRVIANILDADQDGFDVVSAYYVSHIAAKASDAPLKAIEWARRAIARDRNDPLLHALLGIASERARYRRDAATAFVQAHALAPDEPAYALRAAEHHNFRGDFEQAKEAADSYLSGITNDAATRRWSELLALRAERSSGHARLEGRRVRLLYPRSLGDDTAQNVLRAVDEILRSVARMLGQDPREQLTAVVYESSADVQAATCTPSWAGGVYDGVLHLSAEQIRREPGLRSARHEATHAQLAEVRGFIPVWLNEGLAEHFEGETPPGTRAAWQRMVQRRLWIPFASLEGAFIDIDDAQGARLAYQQSLAMVRFLLARRGPAGVREAIERIEAGEPRDLLEYTVRGASGEALLVFLAEGS